MKEEITARVTRVTVVDHRKDSPTNGRVLEAWNVKVELSVQDDGRTLKVFVGDR